MQKEIGYRREAAVSYARQWALSRNPRYLDFQNLGGDCTNFASQCVFAGCGVMNYKQVTGWYYNSSADRTAAWTGVEYLYRFLMENKAAGPYAAEVSEAEAKPGDLVQLGNAYGYYHTPVVVAVVNGRISRKPIAIVHT